MMCAILKNQLRHTVLWFNPEQLADKQKKYGTDLQVVGRNAQPEPAAVGRSVPTLGKNELPKLKEPKKRTGSGCGQNGAKPVINITTGLYYPSSKLAALAIEVNPCRISQLLSERSKRGSVNGYAFRFATPDEQRTEQFIRLVSDSPDVPSSLRDVPNAKPVVSITTGTYYPSIMAAGEAINSIPMAITQHLNGSGSATRKSVKGNVFRFATPEEIQAKRYIP